LIDATCEKASHRPFEELSMNSNPRETTMTTTPGFGRPLYILPFDHRGTFQAKMFGWKGALTAEQTAEIAAMKRVVYYREWVDIFEKARSS
jgi:hypothetical protein